MAFTTIDNPELYFQVKLYTGTGSSQAITLDGDEDMQPDWVWIKERDDTTAHNAYDSVRGVTKYLYVDENGTQVTDAGSLTAFGSDGFTVNNDVYINESSSTYVAWCWKAGTAFSNDASATSVGSIDSSGSINTTAGFSIINFTGNGTAGATVAHGLSAVPKWILVKVDTSDTAYDWRVYHASLGATKNMIFNDGSAVATATNKWNDTAPTSSVFSLGDTSGTNESGSGIITYNFVEKQGFSKFGSFIGNGSLDGTFCFTGFRPAFVLLKCSSHASSNWVILDNKKSNPFNDATCPDALYANDNATESTASPWADLLSNGFKCRGYNEGNTINASTSHTYIYMAFAEAPFVNSNGVPCNAR